jgi:hypothetical protein
MVYRFRRCAIADAPTDNETGRPVIVRFAVIVHNSNFGEA